MPRRVGVEWELDFLFRILQLVMPIFVVGFVFTMLGPMLRELVRRIPRAMIPPKSMLIASDETEMKTGETSYVPVKAFHFTKFDFMPWERLLVWANLKHSTMASEAHMAVFIDGEVKKEWKTNLTEYQPFYAEIDIRDLPIGIHLFELKLKAGAVGETAYTQLLEVYGYAPWR